MCQCVGDAVNVDDGAVDDDADDDVNVDDGAVDDDADDDVPHDGVDDVGDGCGDDGERKMMMQMLRQRKMMKLRRRMLRRKTDPKEAHFVRVCAVEMHEDASQEPHTVWGKTETFC